MKKVRTFFKGLSLTLDALFFRNLTLILATILIWRGIWNFADKYFFPNDFVMSNALTIALGIILLFIFDSEVEEEIDSIENAEKMKHKHKHLLNDHI